MEVSRGTFEAQSLGGSMETTVHTVVLGLWWGETAGAGAAHEQRKFQPRVTNPSTGPVNQSTGLVPSPSLNAEQRPQGSELAPAACRFGEGSTEPGLPAVSTTAEQLTPVEGGGTDGPCSCSWVIMGSSVSRGPP